MGKGRLLLFMICLQKFNFSKLHRCVLCLKKQPLIYATMHVTECTSQERVGSSLTNYQYLLGQQIVLPVCAGVLHSL